MKKIGSKKDIWSCYLENRIFYPSGAGMFFELLSPYFPADKSLVSAYYELEMYTASQELPDSIKCIAGRIISPIYDEKDCVKAFIAWALPGQEKESKYVKIVLDPDFEPEDTFWGLKQARESIIKKRQVYITDNYEDTIAMHAAGFLNTITLLSPFVISKEQITLLRSYADVVILSVDMDEIGENIVDAIMDQMEEVELVVEEMLRPDDKALNIYLREEGKEKLETYLNHINAFPLEETFISNCVVYHETYGNRNPEFFYFLKTIRNIMNMCEISFSNPAYNDLLNLIIKRCRRVNFPPELKKVTENISDSFAYIDELKKVLIESGVEDDPDRVVMERMIKVFESIFIIYIRFRVVMETDRLRSTLRRVARQPEYNSVKKKLSKWKKLNDYFDEFMDPTYLGD